MKLILYYLLSQNFVLGVLASCSFNDSCNHESLYDGSNTSELFTQSTDEMNGRNAETNKQKLKLPNMDVPEEISTFSLSHRIKALRNVFDHLISIERELVWKPLMPSRLSRSNFLVKIFSNLLKIMPFADFLASVREGISNRASCLTCNIIANVYMSPLFSMDIIASATRVVCITFRLQTPRVCNGIVNSFWDVFDYVRSNSQLTPSEMCGAFLGNMCALTPSSKLNWTIDIPPVNEENRKKNNQLAHSKYFKVLQLTDIHFDPYFTPGSRNDCGEPVCCRVANGPADSYSHMASIWGHYTDCDTPFFTVQNSLQRISQQHRDVSYWMMTGDIPPHDIWEYNRNESLAHIKFITLLIKQYSRDIVILPVIGNHEAVPINSFAPPDIDDAHHSPSWLYNYTADQWADWLPEQALATLRKSGNYVMKIKPGFRVIAVNSNYCARLNPWILYDTVDPGGQLAFLRDELLLAEQADDHVHIIGHVPPDHRECTEAWLFNYLKLMKRFKDTITAQFYGHTHRDEFRVVYDVDESTDRDKIPVSFQIICPSITPYSSTNPSYRIYHINSSTHRIQNHFTFFFNLSDDQLRTSSTSYAQPKWSLEYTLNEVTGMNEMNPENMHNLLDKISTQEDHFSEYYRRYYVHSEADVARAWDLVRRDRILHDHSVSNPFNRNPTGLIPV